MASDIVETGHVEMDSNRALSLPSLPGVVVSQI